MCVDIWIKSMLYFNEADISMICIKERFCMEPVTIAYTV